MIGFLRGKIVDKRDGSLIIEAGTETSGVGYDVLCSTRTAAILPDVGGSTELFVHTHYKSDGVQLFGFGLKEEKELFLMLIKVDSVGPKSALNILSAAPWNELIDLIEEGDIAGLTKLPKISKKTAEHVVVKLKGKLAEIALSAQTAQNGSLPAVKASPVTGLRKIKNEAQSALTFLGYRPVEVEKILSALPEDVWKEDLQAVIRRALLDLSGNNP